MSYYRGDQKCRHLICFWGLFVVHIELELGWAGLEENYTQEISIYTLSHGGTGQNNHNLKHISCTFVSKVFKASIS